MLPKPPKEIEDAKPLNDCTLASSFPTLTPTTSLEFSNYVFSSLTFGRTRTILAKWKLFISRELGEKKTCKKWFQFFSPCYLLYCLVFQVQCSSDCNKLFSWKYRKLKNIRLWNLAFLQVYIVWQNQSKFQNQALWLVSNSKQWYSWVLKLIYLYFHEFRLLVFGQKWGNS